MVGGVRTGEGAEGALVRDEGAQQHTEEGPQEDVPLPPCQQVLECLCPNKEAQGGQGSWQGHARLSHTCAVFSGCSFGPQGSALILILPLFCISFQNALIWGRAVLGA